MSDDALKYRTRIWSEQAESDNPFAARVSHCSGFDVYGDLLGKIGWAEYVYLMFTQRPPDKKQARLIHELAVAIAHPGLRDHSVLAAMNAGVGGSTAAACLMAALGVGAGQLNGAHEVFLAVQLWQRCGFDRQAWSKDILNPPVTEITDIWDTIEHVAGFNPNSDQTALTIKQMLSHLASISPDGALMWLHNNRDYLESETGCGLAFSGVAAACMFDLGFGAEQSEMLYLIFRLPGAGAQALEQMEYGWRRFPFYHDGLTLVTKGQTTPESQQTMAEIHE